MLKLANRIRLNVIQSLSEVSREARHVEDVCRCELLLHLIKLVCTHCVEVFSIELLLHLLSAVEVLHVLGHAQQVILKKAVVLRVF